MSDYKIIASDLDGTLLGSDGDISIENINAIIELSKKGVFFVPSSGRTYSEIPQKLKDISDIRYVIYSNGAVVLDRKTGEKISFCISRNTASEISQIIGMYDTHVTFRHDGECYVDAKYFGGEHFEYYNLIKEHVSVITDYAYKREDFCEYLSELDDVEVFSVFFHNKEELTECTKKLRNVKGIKVVKISSVNIEIFNEDAGKGNALMALCDMVGTCIEKTIAVGDSSNDESMVAAAGLGLAMSNARESLKDASDDVICSNDEHVVEYIMKRYF